MCATPFCERVVQNVLDLLPPYLLVENARPTWLHIKTRKHNGGVRQFHTYIPDANLRLPRASKHFPAKWWCRLEECMGDLHFKVTRRAKTKSLLSLSMNPTEMSVFEADERREMEDGPLGVDELCERVNFRGHWYVEEGSEWPRRVAHAWALLAREQRTWDPSTLSDRDCVDMMHAILCILFPYHYRVEHRLVY